MSETTLDSGQPVPEAPVERWEPVTAFDWRGRALPYMEEVENGSWVRYEDYEKLKAEHDLILVELYKFSLEMDQFIKRRFPQ